MIKIRAYGIPAPQGSKKSFGNGYFVEASQRVMPWREAVKEAALRDYQGEPLDGPLKVQIIFLFPRPKKHYGTGKNANILKKNAPYYVTAKNKGDLEKLERSTYDALSESTGGTVMKDDSLVVKNLNEKRYCSAGERPGSIITVSEEKYL
tara:strand:- start:325 stop:774 length:450 start_codon:yes stop_codon:yes gene_type:complete